MSTAQFKSRLGCEMQPKNSTHFFANCVFLLHYCLTVWPRHTPVYRRGLTRSRMLPSKQAGTPKKLRAQTKNKVPEKFFPLKKLQMEMRTSIRGRNKFKNTTQIIKLKKKRNRSEKQPCCEGVAPPRRLRPSDITVPCPGVWLPCLGLAYGFGLVKRFNANGAANFLN